MTTTTTTETFDLVTDEHLELLRRGYEAFAAQDLETVLSVVHPDVVVTQSTEVPWGGEFHGAEGFSNFLMGVVTHLDTAVEIEELYSAGHSAVQIGRTHGTVRANGAAYDHREIHVWRFRDGKAVSMDVHIDVPAMQRALDT